MNKHLTIGKLSLKKELSRNELKEIKGGGNSTLSGSTTCCSNGECFQIGCQPAYCQATGRGTGSC